MAIGQVIFQQTFELASGRETAYEFWVHSPGVVNVTAQGDVNFYAGVYTRAQYEQARAANPMRFPFLVGTARTTHFLRYTIQVPGLYVVAFRVSGWGPGRSATIQVVAQLAP
jgi:hypothetical protein